MKARELREMSDEELESRERDLVEEIFNLRFQIAAGIAENSQILRNVRKDLARLKTVRRERQLAKIA
ncbi:50S ribosomal protein L29 [candidate division KSB3 bacterium]|jgi:large subunit ribosomal protein L29|uniref:Large ribosomal subunit protein uL29 n=1 Tax=candidate division KSB3 bacterium TaxID=2044937 RepID=A0A9D5Q857_9BACT|nr:50S ribosomal protein L29 [candidate division KSB3 bacterium]MBD3326997.1 50S ribosomal protein L29 [candidate division KSB3 bacterium]